MKKKKWRVQLLSEGYAYDKRDNSKIIELGLDESGKVIYPPEFENMAENEMEIELSVIRADNKYKHWGWGDENKIIILSQDTALNPGTKKEIDFMVRAAHILCEGLNKE